MFPQIHPIYVAKSASEIDLGGRHLLAGFGAFNTKRNQSSTGEGSTFLLTTVYNSFPIKCFIDTVVYMEKLLVNHASSMKCADIPDEGQANEELKEPLNPG